MRGAPLADYPMALHPDPRLEAAVRAATARARAMGLTLPPFLVFFVKAPASAALGETVVSAGRRVTVYLRHDLFPRGAYAAMLHELQHATDHELIRAGRLSPAELERRAEAFVHRCAVRDVRGVPAAVPVEESMRKGFGRFVTAEAPVLCDECLGMIPRGCQFRRVGADRRHLACRPVSARTPAGEASHLRRALARRGA